MSNKRYEATVLDVYLSKKTDTNGDPITSVFYQIEKILTADDIVSYQLQSETAMQAMEHYDKEEHWLIDYGNTYAEWCIGEGDTVIFTVKNSRYYPCMHHRDRTAPFKARNINVLSLEKKK